MRVPQIFTATSRYIYADISVISATLCNSDGQKKSQLLKVQGKNSGGKSTPVYFAQVGNVRKRTQKYVNLNPRNREEH